MKYRKQLLVLVWSGLLAWPGMLALGQDFRKVAQELRGAYAQSDKLHVVMKVKVYDEGNEANPYYHQIADVKRDGVNYRYRLGATEMLLNGKYLIMVNRDSKEIICSLRDLAGEEELFKNPVEITLDSVLSFFHEPVLVDTLNSLHHYRAKVKQGPLEQIDVYIDLSEKNVRKIRYRYRDQQLASITFETFTTTPAFAPEVFDEKNYVIISGKEIRPSKAFAQYHIMQATENDYSN